MKMSEQFPSKYIKSDDIGAQRLKLQVANVQLEAVADNEPHKPVMYFNGHNKGMVLNKTNSTACAQIFGDESDNWKGQWVEIMAMPTMYNGKQVMGLVTLPILEQADIDSFQARQQAQPGFQNPGDLARTAAPNTDAVPADIDDIPF